MARKIKMQPPKKRTISEVFEDFVVSRTADGVADVTVMNYQRHLHSMSYHIDLTDILLNRNEFTGFHIGGTGTHNPGTNVPVGIKPSSTRKYVCPCCGMSVRATRVVNIACLDCSEPMLMAG